MTKQNAPEKDRSGTILLIAFAALVAIGAAIFFERPAVAIPPLPQRDALRPTERWQLQVKPEDILHVPGHHVAYWGRPDAKYGERVTREAKPFKAIVIHYTVNKPLLNFVKYQHNGDKRRGGSYGYHIYIGRDGSIVQGAPLSARTNHIKRKGHKARTSVGKWFDGSNALGIGLIGACKVEGRSVTDVKCVGWDATPEQERAALAAAAAARSRFGISKCAVRGHGELQRDRRSYEGTDLAKRIRGRC